MGGSVLLSETFKWSDIVAVEVLMCLVCPHCGSLLPSTVFNVLVSVITWHAPLGVHITISVKPRSVVHPLLSTASAGLLHLSVGAHEHCLGLRAASHHV